MPAHRLQLLFCDVDQRPDAFVATHHPIYLQQRDLLALVDLIQEGLAETEARDELIVYRFENCAQPYELVSVHRASANKEPSVALSFVYPPPVEDRQVIDGPVVIR